jgi:RNA polymerase sigma-70 factor (ECF subfamily)
MKRLPMDEVSPQEGLNARRVTVTNSAEELVARARAGEEEAFRLIFERYSLPVSSFIYDMVGRRELADELMQETFIRAFTGLHKLRNVAKPSTWLFGIARNVALEALRARQAEGRRVETDDPEVAALPSHAAAPDDELLGRECNRVVHEALQRLDEDKRLVMVLRIFHQRSYEEIAEITGFSVVKIKSDLHAARVEVRRRIRPYLEVGK